MYGNVGLKNLEKKNSWFYDSLNGGEVGGLPLEDDQRGLFKGFAGMGGAFLVKKKKPFFGGGFPGKEGRDPSRVDQKRMGLFQDFLSVKEPSRGGPGGRAFPLPISCERPTNTCRKKKKNPPAPRNANSWVLNYKGNRRSAPSSTV